MTGVGFTNFSTESKTRNRTLRKAFSIVFGAGEHDAFADSMRARGLINLKTEIISDSAHYVANEKPDFLVSLIEKYATP